MLLSFSLIFRFILKFEIDHTKVTQLIALSFQIRYNYLISSEVKAAALTANQLQIRIPAILFKERIEK